MPSPTAVPRSRPSESSSEAYSSVESIESHESPAARGHSVHVEQQEELPGEWWQFWKWRRVRKAWAWLNERRVKQLARNAWIELPDRSDRLEVIKMHVDKQTEIEVQHLEDANKVIQWLVWFWRHCLFALDATLEVVSLITGQMDQRTGLPTSLLLRWTFISKDCDSPHGIVFRGHKAHNMKQQVCLRLRDKSRGVVYTLMRNRHTQHKVEHLLLPSRGVLAAIRGAFGLCKLDKLVGGKKERFFHECLVEQYAFYDNHEFYVEVTEYLKGGSLYQYIRNRSDQLSDSEAIIVARRLLSGLRYLHARDLIHRDVRMCQLILAHPDKLDTVKLGDVWRMAHIPHDKEMIIEHNKPVDVSSAAPEVLLKGYWSRKADVWSAAVLLFELLEGHPPFSGKDEALARRICEEEPEFDQFGGQTTETAKKLLKLMLLRRMERRLYVNEVLAHEWFSRKHLEENEMKVDVTPALISDIKLAGKPPLSRPGMGAHNLVNHVAGGLNRGFCSDVTSISSIIDFEIGARSKKCFWVSYAQVSLWGIPENPKTIFIETSQEQSFGYCYAAEAEVSSQHDTQCIVEVNRPIKFARIKLLRNHGGSFGVAIRSLNLFGYEVKAVPVVFDFQHLNYKHGAHEVTTSDMIPPNLRMPKSMHYLVEQSLAEDVTVDGEHYLRLRSVHSGRPHRSTAVFTKPISFPAGVDVVHAGLHLVYHSNLSDRGFGTTIAFNVLVKKKDVERDDASDEEDEEKVEEENEDEKRTQEIQEVQRSFAYTKEKYGERIRLFETEPLRDSGCLASEVHKHGFTKGPGLHCGLKIASEQEIRLEVTFNNNSTQVLLPRIFGFYFYYIPLIGVDDNFQPDVEFDEDQGDTDSEEIQDGAPAAGTEKKNSLRAGMATELLSRDEKARANHEAEVAMQRLEEAKQKEMDRLAQKALYDTSAGTFLGSTDVPVWKPHDMMHNVDINEMKAERTSGCVNQRRNDYTMQAGRDFLYRWWMDVIQQKLMSTRASLVVGQLESDEASVSTSASQAASAEKDVVVHAHAADDDDDYLVQRQVIIDPLELAMRQEGAVALAQQVKEEIAEEDTKRFDMRTKMRLHREEHRNDADAGPDDEETIFGGFGSVFDAKPSGQGVFGIEGLRTPALCGTDLEACRNSVGVGAPCADGIAKTAARGICCGLRTSAGRSSGTAGKFSLSVMQYSRAS